MIALIDADSIIYILAWHHKDTESIAQSLVLEDCDKMVEGILSACSAKQYIGSFSSPQNFRHRLYKYASYKGTRKEKDEWVKRWEAPIKKHLCDKWGFFIPFDLEADDVISGAWHMLGGVDCVVCSPDKDLMQIPGPHYDYKKTEVINITHEEAGLYLAKQMLMGDSSDNVKGLPGIGEVKAKALLKEPSIISKIRELYHVQFGEHYGPIIHLETVIALQLLCPTHPLWQDYKTFIEGLVSMHLRTTAITEEESIFNEES